MKMAKKDNWAQLQVINLEFALSKLKDEGVKRKAYKLDIH